MKNKLNKTHRRPPFALALSLAALHAGGGQLAAQQQFQGVCAQVEIVIEQELTLERIGFEATLEVTNNGSEDPLTEFSAELSFEDPLLSTDGETNDASDMFFVRPPTLTSVNATDGTGVIGPTKTAVVRWFIIPKITAGGEDPRGKEYRVGCQLGGKLQGVEIPVENMFAVPDTITVRPEPQLQITYFQPRDVQGDDPFTPQVESPVPFTLGVLVSNAGFGPARDLKIDSQQPKIVENKNGLLLVARLLGSRVQDSPLEEASLLVDLGDLEPGETKKGAWDMITSLSGEFVEFNASYTHAPELGGEATSVITSLEAHFIAREVLNDEPGRDDILDFLADTDRDLERVPDALYESDGPVLPVNRLLDVDVAGGAGAGNVVLTVNSDREGWGYMRVADPGQAKLEIAGVVRSDGKSINLNNVWTDFRFRRLDNAQLNFLHLLDRVEAGRTYTYAVTYAPPADDGEPPVTRLRFSGPVFESGGVFTVTPETQLYFTSEDESPVSITYSLDGGARRPALPFSLDSPGAHTVAFSAIDAAGNVEVEQTVIVTLLGGGPAVASAGFGVGTLFHAGDAVTVRPGAAPLEVDVAPHPLGVDAAVDVFAGVVAFPQVSGVPPSPTPSRGAELTVGGDLVEFYQYRLGGGAWSAERAVAEPLVLAGLPNGPVDLEVRARHGAGGYGEDEDGGDGSVGGATRNVTARWVVDPAAPEIAVAGLATPARASAAGLTVSVPGVELYRWTVDNGFYRPEEDPSVPFALPELAPGEHTLGLIARRGGVWQEIADASELTFTIDPAYGTDFSGLALVRSAAFPGVEGRGFTFVWDGADGAGVPQLPGAYTARVTLTDPVGGVGAALRVVEVGEISAPLEVAANARAPSAAGGWAVWQERTSGAWNIVGARLPLAVGGGGVVPLTASPVNQEAPHTDGRYVVWQGRQANGATDIFLLDLEPDPLPAPTNLTNTTAASEVNAVVDWPWVVFQSKPLGDSAAPWQLFARDLRAGGPPVPVDPSTADQLDPSIHLGRVVWADHRDVGPGEIYFAHLETAERRRLTTNGFVQARPTIHGHQVVWQDGRDLQLDLWGIDLRGGAEVRLTATAYNETDPVAAGGGWVLYLEDSLGPLTANLRALDLASGGGVALTRSLDPRGPAAAAGRAVLWAQGGAAAGAGGEAVWAADFPGLQTVFADRNAVPVTAALADRYPSAFALLADWQAAADASAVSRFVSLFPAPVEESARWEGGAPAGDDFPLEAGAFLWVDFGGAGAQVLDLGAPGAAGVDLPAGVSALSYLGFPAGYTAYRLVDQIGADKVRAARLFNAAEGRWRSVENPAGGTRVGADFPVPRSAVVLLDLAQPVDDWRPGEGE